MHAQNVKSLANPDANAKREEEVYQRRRKLVSLFSLAVLVAFFIVMFFTVGRPLLQMISKPDEFRLWVDANGILGRFAMVGMMALQVIVAIIPGEPMEVGAGYAFGCLEGTILCMIGAAIGSCIVFAFAKKFGIKMVEAFISREKLHSLKFIHNAKRLDLLIFILFFIPGTPKDILTYFAGLTPIKLSKFLLLTTFARIPSIVTSTIAGNALGLERYWLAVIVFAITAVLSLTGGYLYWKISQRNTLSH